MAKPMTKTEWMNWLEKAWDEAQQREWVGLTDEEIEECFVITPDQFLKRHTYKRIEAKLKEKNGG